jgi:type I restriction enzyme S subunit
MGSTHKTIYMPDIKAFQLAVPSPSTQRTIASFLNRKTAAIDVLIVKKERLIELLQEKRQALITQAVTKGLDADVPMKDSGIEWLGKIPAEWSVRPLKRIAMRIVVGIAQAATHAYSASGVPIIRSTNIRTGRLLLDQLLFIDEKFANQLSSKFVFAGDLLTVRTGNAGVTAVVPPSLPKSQCFTMLITTLRSPHLSEFYCYQLNSDVGTTQFALEAWGTAQANISVPILGNALVAVPDASEQEAIVRHLDLIGGRVLSIADAVRTQIDRLREYRQALITAAVTGKLDIHADHELPA